MALTKKQSITLTGQSNIIVDNAPVTVVQMTANIKEDGNSNITTTIVNKDLYEANKKACRADMDEFTVYVREVEDSYSI